MYISFLFRQIKYLSLALFLINSPLLVDNVCTKNIYLKILTKWNINKCMLKLIRLNGHSKEKSKLMNGTDDYDDDDDDDWLNYKKFFFSLL